jgi:beta-glucosidase
MVLLKNERNVLPLQRRAIKTVAIIGPNAYPAVPQGGGSVTVAPFRTVSFLEGMSEAHPEGDVQWVRGIPDLRTVANATRFSTTAAGEASGVTVETFDNADLTGAASTRIEPYINQGAPLDFTPMALGEMDRSVFAPVRPVSVRWTGYHTPSGSGLHDVFIQFGNFGRGVGHRLYIDDRLVSDRWSMKHAAVEQLQLQFETKPHKIVVEYRGEVGGIYGTVPFVRLGILQAGTWVDPAAEQMARTADAVVVAVGFDMSSELEDWDRTFSLPPGQNELIRKVAAANKNTIVVVTSGGAVDMNGWQEQIPALLQAWYPGQEGGTALAEILFGDVNPSGRLPATFERRPPDNPAYSFYYPEAGSNRILYKEGVFVGYRGSEKSGSQPLFPFGHGLSYTTFDYSDLNIVQRSSMPGSDAESVYDVSFTITNKGSRAGAAVPQVYVADGHARVSRPAKELKGFSKVMLQPGEARTVTIPLNRRAFSYYDVQARKWRADAGTFGILVGSSVAKIELEGQAKLPRTLTF